jgi:hypothetical protein
MSLILDALRKLEREKGAQEPGVLVVGSVPWGERSRLKSLALRAGGVLALALAVLLGFLLRRGPAGPPPLSTRTATPAPQAAPAASASSTPVQIAGPPRSEPRASITPPPQRTRLAPDAASAPARPASVVPLTGDAREAPPAEASADSPPAPAARATPSGELRLTAISERDGKPVALINDRLVFEGDSFDGVRVIRIGVAEVEIEFKGQRRVLRF